VVKRQEGVVLHEELNILPSDRWRKAGVPVCGDDGLARFVLHAVIASNDYGAGSDHSASDEQQCL
jgi:hypothetical protein